MIKKYSTNKKSNNTIYVVKKNIRTKNLKIKGGSGDTVPLKLVTANVLGFDSNEYINTDFDIRKDDLTKKLINDKPDFICLQESAYHELDKVGDYKMVAHNIVAHNMVAHNMDANVNDGDIINVFQKNDSIWKVSNTEYVEHNCNNTKRVSIILTLTNNDKTVKLAVCHLCGGKYDDDNLIKKPNSDIEIDEELNKEIDKYNKNINGDKIIKDDAILNNIKKNFTNWGNFLNKIIAYNPDIILGDFNMDYEFNMQTSTAKKVVKYYNEKGIPYFIYLLLNMYIFNKLKNYTHIINNKKDWKSLYIKNHTTPFDSSVDVIFIKNSHYNYVKPKDFKILELMNDDINKRLSDHNGLYTELLIGGDDDESDDSDSFAKEAKEAKKTKAKTDAKEAKKKAEAEKEAKEADEKAEAEKAKEVADEKAEAEKAKEVAKKAQEEKAQEEKDKKTEEEKAQEEKAKEAEEKAKKAKEAKEDAKKAKEADKEEQSIIDTDDEYTQKLSVIYLVYIIKNILSEPDNKSKKLKAYIFNTYLELILYYHNITDDTFNSYKYDKNYDRTLDDFQDLFKKIYNKYDKFKNTISIFTQI